jgi:hypothetical protein
MAPDATVVIDATPMQPDATPCVVECIDPNTIRDCSMGSPGEPRGCNLGCVMTGSGDDHCATQIVSNDPLADAHVIGVPATADLIVDAIADDPPMSFYTHWEIFTDTGQIFDANTDTTWRAAGTGVDALTGVAYYDALPGIGVFVFDSVAIEEGARLWVYGSRALLIISLGDVVVNGVIDVTAGVSPDGTTVSMHYPGPGGFAGGVGSGDSDGCAGGGHGDEGSGASTDETGGGGGALAVGRNGAPGGDGAGELGGAGGVPGASCPSATVVPLEGGSGGGAGGGTSSSGGMGGGGGGAVQITSFTSIDVAMSSPSAQAGVWAGGQGGQAGGSSNGGGGGGSGGAILLEAPVVSLGAGAFLAANGGGGGAGASTGATANGSLGGTGLIPAPGGIGTRAGGAGGAGTTDPTAGVGGGDGTGGGGGAAGIIAVLSLDATVGGLVSPGATIEPLPVE